MTMKNKMKLARRVTTLELLNVKKQKMEVDLEEALDLVGTGKYQIIHSALMLATLTAALLEMIGSAFILPAATCDLQIPENLKGIITSVPNIGVILTAAFWGRAADSLGRKPMLLVSTAAAGVIAFISSFMPNLVGFALCKLAAALFLACPSSLGYAYAGEMLPRRRRDLTLLICNGLLMVSSSLSPLLAWAVLSSDWAYDFGSINMRPWRLLTAVYSMPLMLISLWMTQADESPKFLMAKGRHQEALEVLKRIYARNSGLVPDDFPVTSLKYTPEESEVSAENCSDCELSPNAKNSSALALVRPPHLKWLALTGFLMFGLFSLLNGLFLFSTSTINKVMKESSEEEGTICILMGSSETNATNTEVCVDKISHDTFFIMTVTTLVYGAVVMLASLCPVSKKTMLVTMFAAVGVACLMSGLLTNRIVAGVLMSALQTTSLGIGPLTAYAVHLFPTSLRATAVGAVLMFGRLGSVVGANTAGVLLPTACTATFYGFSILLFFCAALSFLLPKEQTPINEERAERTSR